MQITGEPEVTPTIAGDTIVGTEGKYIYCVADSGETVGLGKIGIDENEVYTIGYRDICAVAHRCPAEPYKSDDPEAIEVWVLRHQQVIDAAWERWGTVLPLAFDTIIAAREGSDAEQNTWNWLREEYQNLKGKIERVRGKAEYGVQVFWEPKLIAQNLSETSPEIRQLEEEISTKSRGLAYMYRQKLEGLLRREMEAEGDDCFKDFYRRIKAQVDDIRVEKTKTRKADQGLQMIMNLSCLVARDKYLELGRVLEEIDKMEGFSIRFTGPWPPYSFVGI